MQNMGALLHQADPASQAAVANAVRSAYGVFFVLQPWDLGNTNSDPEKELLQGRNVIWACHVARIKHVVFSSIINPDNIPSGIPHFDNKVEIERMIQKKQLPFTIIRCGIFMDNIGYSFMRLSGNVFSSYFAGATALPFLSYDDVGKCTVHLFNNPDEFLGQTLDLAGDLVSGEQLAGIARKVCWGRDFFYGSTPPFLIRVFRPADYVIRRYFERYSTGEGQVLMIRALQRSRSLFPYLKIVEDMLAALIR